MDKTRAVGWQKLVEGYPWFVGEGSYPIPAYSEFMPAPCVGRSLYGDIDEALFAPDDPYGWRVPEIDQEYELQPGLEHVAGQVMAYLVKFGRGEQENHVVGHNRRLIEGNRYWSPELDARLGHFEHERYVMLLPVALAKTQD